MDPYNLSKSKIEYYGLPLIILGFIFSYIIL